MPSGLKGSVMPSSVMGGQRGEGFWTDWIEGIFILFEQNAGSSLPDKYVAVWLGVVGALPRPSSGVTTRLFCFFSLSSWGVATVATLDAEVPVPLVLALALAEAGRSDGPRLG